MKRMTHIALLITLAVFLATAAGAQELVRTVELGFSYGEYDGDLGVSRGQSLGLLISRPYVWDWRIGVGRAHRFHTDGSAIGTSLTRHLPGGVSASLGFGRGKGGVVLSDYRFDASLGVGVLPRRQLLLNLGYTRNQSEGENYSDGVGLGASWYLGRWILGGHFLHDTGYPGKTISRSGGVSLTYSLWRKLDLGAGITFGKVSYTLVSPGFAHVDYSANGSFAGVNWWAGERWGVNLRLDYGETDFYRFRGFTFGVFREW